MTIDCNIKVKGLPTNFAVSNLPKISINVRIIYDCFYQIQDSLRRIIYEIYHRLEVIVFKFQFHRLQKNNIF